MNNEEFRKQDICKIPKIECQICGQNFESSVVKQMPELEILFRHPWLTCAAKQNFLLKWTNARRSKIWRTENEPTKRTRKMANKKLKRNP